MPPRVLLALLYGAIGALSLILLIILGTDPTCNSYVEAHSGYTRGVCE